MNSLLSYFSLQIPWGNCPSIRADVPFCDWYLSMEKLPSNLARRKSLCFTIKLQIHITQNTLHAFTARHVFMCHEEKISIHSMYRATSIAYVRATNISNWFTRESCDKSVCYNYFYLFLFVIKGLLVIRNACISSKKYRFSLIKYLLHLFLTCNNSVIFYINYIYDKK